MTGNRTALTLALLAITLIVQPGDAVTQTQPSGPMFSTPASRSTTGTPILNDTTKDANGIIDLAGGGASAKPAPAPPPAQAAVPQADSSAPDGKRMTFGNWAIQCKESSGTAGRCQMRAESTSPDGHQVILVMSLAKSADTSSMAYQTALPLGIALQKPVSVSVDEDFKAELSVSRCTPQGCLLEGAADGRFVEAMKTGAEAKFVVTTPEGQSIPITLPLNGFSVALAALPDE